MPADLEGSGHRRPAAQKCGQAGVALVLAAGRKLGLQLPRPRAPDELGMAGLGCELGLTQRAAAGIFHRLSFAARAGRRLR